MSKLNFDLQASNDDDFFGSLDSNRSNLGKLFGIGEKHDDNPNSATLKYQPPKQTPTKIAATAPSQTWNTILAKVASAYKENESVGKVGVALLINAANECKLIVYKTKTNVMATLTLNLTNSPGSEQIHSQSRYLQFYDDDRYYWSLFYDKTEDEQEFRMKLKEFGVKIRQDTLPTEVQSEKVEEQTEEMAEISKKINVTLPALKSNENLTDTKETHNKSNLINRMAKMGQQLPKFTAPQHNSTTTECSDSSDAEVVSTPLAVINSKPSIVPRSSKLQMLKTQVGIYNAEVSTVNPAMESQFMQMLLTENRTQNTEMRMNMNKLEGKIEKVLDRIDSCSGRTEREAQKSNKEDEILELEEKLLKLKKENRKLKQTAEDRSQRNDERRIVEEILMKYEDDLETVGVTITHDLDQVIGNLLHKLKASQVSWEKSKSDLMETKKELNEKELLVINEKEKHSLVLTKVAELSSANDSITAALTLKEKDNAELQQKLTELKQLTEAKVVEANSKSASTIKTIMNNLYGNLEVQMDNAHHTLQKDEILAIIGQTIRADTLKAIEQLSKQ